MSALVPIRFGRRIIEILLAIVRHLGLVRRQKVERSSITRERLKELAEAQGIERKRSLKHQKEGFEALCGMMNTDVGKGAVLFGVEPDGTPVGVERGDIDSAQRKLAEHFRTKLDPKTPCSIQVVDCEDKVLVFVEGTRDRSVPYFEYDGRAWIREGTSTRVLSVAEKAQLVRRRSRALHGGPWICDACGTQKGMIMHVVHPDHGTWNQYKCQCGGEYWPA
jgi:Schlafen, AlbA_2